MKILIIEDEQDLSNLITLGLKKYGYTVETAFDGKTGLEMVYINDYNLIVLDLNLPLMDGMKVLEEIRKFNKEIKIIILSARFDYTDRIEGLDTGANDYLTKPFHFGELEARIRSLLRRNFIQENSEITVKDFILNTANHTIFYKDRAITELSPKEFAVLQYLMMNKNKAISAEELIEHIWYSETEGFSNSIKVHISGLRKKLAKYRDDEIISNIRGVGYIIKD